MHAWICCIAFQFVAHVNEASPRPLTFGSYVVSMPQMVAPFVFCIRSYPGTRRWPTLNVSLRYPTALCVVLQVAANICDSDHVNVREYRDDCLG